MLLHRAAWVRRTFLQAELCSATSALVFVFAYVRLSWVCACVGCGACNTHAWCCWSCTFRGGPERPIAQAVDAARFGVLFSVAPPWAGSQGGIMCIPTLQCIHCHFHNHQLFHLVRTSPSVWNAIVCIKILAVIDAIWWKENIYINSKICTAIWSWSLDPWFQCTIA